MRSKNKFIFFLLLTLAIFLVAYLIAQIIIPEPLTEKLTNLANPPTSAAETLVTAYLENQPDRVRNLLARPYRDRIWHQAALAETAILPAQAMQQHTAEFNGYCQEKIENKIFFLVQTETLDQDRVKCVVYAGKKNAPGAAVLSMIMLKENDGVWRCEQITKHE